MDFIENSLIIAYLNCRGQTGLNLSKQLQIQDFLQTNSIDILHLQEVHIDDSSFSECKFISSNFYIIHINSNTKYGTASIIKSTLAIEDVILHHSGRIILFNIGNITFGNVYLPSGTDGQSRASRENYCGETIPTLLIHSKSSGMIGGDWNSIISKEDCTRHPEAKMSPCLKRVVKTFSWQDSFRFLHANDKSFSRFYSNERHGDGATRIDRSYFFGDVVPTEAKYVSVAFSDHLSYIVTLKLPSPLATILSPKSRPLFKTKPEIVKDKVFQARLANSMKEWEAVKQFGVPTLTWWEVLVKPGIKKLAIERGKEINKERRSLLNLLMLRQTYLTRKVQQGEMGCLATLKEVQLRVEDWFSIEVEKVKHQSRVDDIQRSEKVRIYHHEIHQKHIRKSAILKLETEQGLIEGHPACSAFLQKVVEDLLLNPAILDLVAQNTLLAEIEEQFTEKDNQMITAVPTKDEVEESVKTSNVHGAPGTDGITSLVYRECFHILGDALTDVVQTVFGGDQPTLSQRTSLMMFSCKPGKTKSLKPKDKRRLSLLNTDFKVITGVEVGRYNQVITHTLCPQQLAAGNDRRISFGICLARDAIYAAGKRKSGCGIADNDFEAAFDFLCLDWVRKVLQKKGLAEPALDRFTNLYKNGITIPVINNILGMKVENKRLSLRQGDRPSGIWFCYGIDPLLVYLEKRLEGILIHSLPVLGPVQPDQASPLPPLDTRYKVQGYLDDCKPAITSMSDFHLVDYACNMFEKSSGCKLHRDPASNKCKMLPLGRWIGTLDQEDIPLPYLKLTDHLDYLGCKLYANYVTTRRENGNILRKKVKDQVDSWKSGKFMSLTSRPWSINTYCLAKLWYRTGCLDLRIGDSDAITSSIKSWLYQDQLEKPQELMLYRQAELGGLGVHHVKMRAMAMLIHTFLSQAICPNFTTNQYYNTLYRWHVLEERNMADPGHPPYYSLSFFNTIKDIHLNTPLNVTWITVKQWYQLLLEKGVTHTSEDPDSPPLLISSRAEENHPEVNFPTAYRLARKFGLSPDQKSFLFKMMKGILPTRDRLTRLRKVQSPSCTFCGQLDSITHIISCTNSSEVTTPFLQCMATHVENSTPHNITMLNLETTESMELPIVWLIATCLGFVWEERVAGRQCRLDTFRAVMLARVALLRQTHWKHYSLHNSVVLLEEMINLHFN